MAETTIAPETTITPAPTVNPETHDPVSGKPWKELAREHERKSTESQEENARLKATPPVSAPPRESRETVDSYHQRLNQLFVEDPAKAMIQAVSDGVGYGIRSIKAANKQLKAVKADFKKRFEDYEEVVDEFDEVLEDAPIERMTTEGLELVFQSVRAKKLEAKLVKLREKAGKEEAPRIVGPTSPSASGSPATPVGQKPLTKEQASELASMQKMGDLSDDGYRRQMKARQERAKKLNIPEAQWPQTLSEPLKRPPT